ncbi:dihydrofolate reductase family protein [Streptomyces sp. YIM 103828]|uniref:dihydrofolate reductase family protein n=1 Tax=Streptomyces sp. YIM 103828 TaxID=3158968 RepID=UPI0032D94B28
MAEAVRIGPDAAGGGNLEVLSPTVGRQLLERGLIDEIDLHVAPVLLGDGVRLFDNRGRRPRPPRPAQRRRPGPRGEPALPPAPRRPGPERVSRLR